MNLMMKNLLLNLQKQQLKTGKVKIRIILEDLLLVDLKGQDAEAEMELLRRKCSTIS